MLNDSTYGHDVTRTAHATDGGEVLGHTVRLTLLRAPHSPDPETDLGVHRFRYALLPGAGVAEAVAEGLALNLPLRALPAGPAERAPLVSVDNPAITIESVKLAEDRQRRCGGAAVRVPGRPGGGHAGDRLPGAGARTVTDLLERPLHEAATGPAGLNPGAAPAPDPHAAAAAGAVGGLKARGRTTGGRSGAIARRPSAGWWRPGDRPPAHGDP
ncbi:hypothetical protein TPA0910_00040 [Streptomyces hygroscopicus subsp. sporocinereus]|uniref:Uncharacterized protein n=1 Tax=Streptomyces hygroscopicus TaxID=1912 RepID=A0ABQ3TQF5_STRHY|nr:hypothetical protein TPA0910_00040 [Streptomyces hygroscopicus]